ncbi:hypothetical protein [Arthrobacter sp. zg-Y1171]|uniref:hypothetical protein n=1 Tax=Arthrobacter sp. zg-Y1171 TaxID=2964610 RepID=UPI0021041845|nr:hypothetical protein [Arthrobacter sp. zg-Y1171]MCQ1995126.1 hypothetical protein [Arthrobacter sp. zg-Y1171]UWX80827.1 hypothetical protein N2L00_10375 [Arthrobacter sp. zg-Y1171]
MPRGADRESGRNTAASALIWSFILLAAPFLGFPPGAALPWGAGAALLMGVFPAVLVTYLQRHNDLRSLPPSSLPPTVLGAAALAFMFQRLILWLDGPLPLSAAAFALLAAVLVLLVANAFTSWSWLDLTLGVGIVILGSTAALLFQGLPGTVSGVVIACALALFLAARLQQGRPAGHLLAAAAGAAAGGGVFLWLLSYAQ